MDIQQQLPLAPRDLLILSALAEGPLHGYGIIRAVEERSQSGVLLDPANLYRALRRMERVGWIEEADAQDEASDRRRTYRVTREGALVLRAEVARLERLIERTRPVLAEGTGSGPA